MAFGDIGGAVTELIVICKTNKEGSVNIAKGDALRLVGNYTVDNVPARGGPLFGQAMENTDKNGVALPVKVRGICRFKVDPIGPVPIVDGMRGINDMAATIKGRVTGYSGACEVGVNLEVNEEERTVDVLL